jgi:hypothetical protein
VVVEDADEEGVECNAVLVGVEGRWEKMESYEI